jgi:hypothetical protein
MNSFEAKRAARKDRQAARAQRLTAEADSLFRSARQAIEHIPPGQPILVGHHSEKHHRRDLARHDTRMRKAVETHKRAEEAARRAAIESTAISSDDPDAADKIRERIAELEAKQQRMIAANKLVRKEDRVGLAAMGFTPTVIDGLLSPDFAGRYGFPGYMLTNNNGNIRRLRERLVELERRTTAQPKPDIVGDGWVIREDVEDNRILIIFDGKPSAERRARLKSNGFRWSPSRSAWVRQLNNRARFWAEEAVKP